MTAAKAREKRKRTKVSLEEKFVNAEKLRAELQRTNNNLHTQLEGLLDEVKGYLSQGNTLTQNAPDSAIPLISSLALARESMRLPNNTTLPLPATDRGLTRQSSMQQHTLSEIANPLISNTSTQDAAMQEASLRLNQPTAPLPPQLIPPRLSFTSLDSNQIQALLCLLQPQSHSVDPVLGDAVTKQTSS
jgi:hypothetical protein